jgi:HD superfamily phosphodiesterase
MELNYRVSLNIASYLENIGNDRQLLFKKVKKLYESRSKAAHGRANEDYNDYNESYALLKRAIVKIIEENHVPTMADIEQIILCDKKFNDS